MKEWIAVGILEGLTGIMIVVSIVKAVVENRRKKQEEER